MNVFKKAVTLAAAVSLVCLSSAGAMAANKLIVKDSTGVTDKFVVTDAGFVGIGKTPTVALDLVGLAGQSRIVIQTLGTSNIGGGGFIGLHNNATADNSGFPRLGDRIGFHLFGTKNPTTGVIWTGGGFQVMAEANWTATSMPTYFAFETANVGSTSKYERLRITASGNTNILGGIQMAKNAGSPAKPACTSAADRGMIWYTSGPTGFKDYLQVCAKGADENYAWRLLY